MPYEISWVEPGLIFMARHYGQSSVADVEGASRDAIALMEAEGKVVHFIMDVREMKNLPLIQLSSNKLLLQFIQHPLLGWSGVVGMNASLAFWLKVFIKLFSLRYSAFDTIEDAVTFLRDFDRIQTDPHKRGR